MQSDRTKFLEKSKKHRKLLRREIITYHQYKVIQLVEYIYLTAGKCNNLSDGYIQKIQSWAV